MTGHVSFSTAVRIIEDALRMPGGPRRLTTRPSDREVQALYALQGAEGEFRDAPRWVNLELGLPEFNSWESTALAIIGQLGDDYLAMVLPRLGIDDPNVEGLDPF